LAQLLTGIDCNKNYVEIINKLFVSYCKQYLILREGHRMRVFQSAEDNMWT